MEKTALEDDPVKFVYTSDFTEPLLTNDVTFERRPIQTETYVITRHHIIIFS